MIGVRKAWQGLPASLVAALDDATWLRGRGVGLVVARGQHADAPPHEVRVTGVPWGSDLERALMGVPGCVCERSDERARTCVFWWRAPDVASPVERAS